MYMMIEIILEFLLSKVPFLFLLFDHVIIFAPFQMTRP